MRNLPRERKEHRKVILAPRGAGSRVRGDQARTPLCSVELLRRLGTPKEKDVGISRAVRNWNPIACRGVLESQARPQTY